MEKTIVFLPIIIFFGFFLLLIILFLGFIAKLIFKAKKDSWVGVVIDRGHNTKHDDEKGRDEHFYFLRVKLENGEEHNIPAAAEFYNEIKIGDKLKKEAGSPWPKKI